LNGIIRRKTEPAAEAHYSSALRECVNMAQKEDILEQIVEKYLTHEGYFVQHNIKFKPDPAHPQYHSKHDSVPSDIDVLAIHPHLSGPDKVVAVPKTHFCEWESLTLDQQQKFDVLIYDPSPDGNPDNATLRAIVELKLQIWREAPRSDIE